MLAVDAAGGVVRYLEERKVGFKVGPVRVPIVPAAILFDLGIGSGVRRPDAEMGYQACLNASRKVPAEGSVGAGTGATVGKILGMGQAVKGGVASAAMEIGAGVQVGAIVAVNVFGDVIDPETGKIIAGARSLKKGPFKIGKGQFADTMQVMKSLVGRSILGAAQRSNTAIGVVATNAKLDKEGATKVARMAMNGIARTVRPANTMLDGDTLFALATGVRKADVNIVGAYAAEVVGEAVVPASRPPGRERDDDEPQRAGGQADLRAAHGVHALLTDGVAGEEESRRLRGKDIAPCRLLFLDEAARLDGKSIATLFELCERQDMQLLIAAPENISPEKGTTYKLIRKVQGKHEHVHVVGLRGFGFADDKLIA